MLTVDKFMVGLGKRNLDLESIDKIRDVLSSVLNSAMRYGLLVRNPAEGTRLPRSRRAKKGKPFLTQEQFNLNVGKVTEPYATMLYTAACTGLRVSELIGLQWRDVHEDSITVDVRCSRGEWGVPKSEASNATIAVNRQVIERLHRLKDLTIEFRAGRAVRRVPAVKSAGPDDLVFQSVLQGKTMRDSNILVRHLKPAAREVGLPWVNWLVLRSSFATRLKIKGAEVKDAQALMRHSRASTTLDIYQQFVPESQRRVVDGLVN